MFFVCELHPFKQYNGSKARFETGYGTETLEVYTHNISDYLDSAAKSGLRLLQLNEWWDEGDIGGIPRLVSLLFIK